ncbi:DUF6293 family protein [Nitrosopumilus adriaticus]|uniref:HFX_2341 family transcriptional regulator domain-containing protein n=1 Tax=Nitrosopumilus adriaticus TaxID=1580092 RepID=UPI00352FDB2A
MDKRIHIVPVGYDSYSRVVEPLLDPRADKIYFIRHEKGAIRNHNKFFKTITKEIEKTGIPYDDQIEIDIWDLFQCVEIFRKIIEKETVKQNHVFINVSTGTKVTAMAGILACMMWNQTPYYVKLTNPTKKRIVARKIAVDEAEKLPTFDIKKPDYKTMKVLERIVSFKDEMVRKWQLTDYLVDEGIIKPVNRKKTFSVNAKLAQLQVILYPMEKYWKFIETEHRGSRSQVKITEKGKQALQIFGIPKD